MRIKEFAEISGISVRTLHYYDEIGLLKPADIDSQTGYRYYDESSLLRMQEILFYRELDFSLKSIA
jgi:DNA-binding transcriptional MerR regulator